MGMVVFESGKRVAKTWGVQAPAAMRICVQGTSVSVEVSVCAMRMLESSPWMASAPTERALAG